MNMIKEFKLDDTFTYKAHRLLFIGVIILMACFLYYVLSYDSFTGQQHYYSECPMSTANNTYGKGCFNSFYGSNLCADGTIASDNLLCTIKYMEPGMSIGIKPPWFITYFETITYSLIVLTLIINTLIFNPGFFKWVRGKINND